MKELKQVGKHRYLVKDKNRVTSYDIWKKSTTGVRKRNAELDLVPINYNDETGWDNIYKSITGMNGEDKVKDWN